MIIFSVLMMWAFDWKEYQVQPREPNTSIWRPLWDSINLCTPLSSAMSLSDTYACIDAFGGGAV